MFRNALEKLGISKHKKLGKKLEKIEVGTRNEGPYP